MTDDLQQYLHERRLQVEQSLSLLLAPYVEFPDALVEAMRYSALAPGKRLRPLLVLLANEACGDREEAALPAACAVEMVHVYSLIHDDLPAMDDDDMRRGQPTCHKQFGEALAILAGDALLTLAFETLAKCYAATTAAACCLELARGAGAAGMVGGQVEDLAWEQSERRSVSSKCQGGRGGVGPTCQDQIKALDNIHARKTGALFRACLRIGYHIACGGATSVPDAAKLDALDAYGRCFGLAFQITDDLLDIEGNAEQTGKRVQKDAARGKLTYPSLWGVEESRRRARQLGLEACEHLQPFGTAGERLKALVTYVLERKH